MSLSRKQTLSFEMMPPRSLVNSQATQNFWDCANALIETKPDFISITYGAAGNDRATSLEVISKLVDDTPILPIAHLTCIATRQEDLDQTASDFLAAGVRMFLALRGDPPKGVDMNSVKPSKIETTAELTAFLRQLDRRQQRESSQFRFKSISRPLVICVAAMIDGNPALGTSQDDEIVRLLEKQDAGADFAITQLYHDSSIYDSFVSKARKRGVTIPILAGVLPTWDVERILRCENNLGVKAPGKLISELSEATDDEKRAEIGLSHLENLCRNAIDSGSPGIHMFTFNKPNPPLQLAKRIGLI